MLFRLPAVCCRSHQSVCPLGNAGDQSQPTGKWGSKGVMERQPFEHLGTDQPSYYEVQQINSCSNRAESVPRITLKQPA